MPKAKVRKTKVGSEYRVRDKDGEIRGEFNRKNKAKTRKAKVSGGHKSAKKRKKK